jgi:hypothetical protein
MAAMRHHALCHVDGHDLVTVAQHFGHAGNVACVDLLFWHAPHLQLVSVT